MTLCTSLLFVDVQYQYNVYKYTIGLLTIEQWAVVIATPISGRNNTSHLPRRKATFKSIKQFSRLQGRKVVFTGP